jgi:hypothetical protein
MTKKRKQGEGAIDQALAEWRAAEVVPERLSGPVRERILDEIKGGGERRMRYTAPASLFFPLRRFALASAVPALVLALAAGYFLTPGPQGDPALQATTTDLQVLRQGDEVVFVIANGKTTHMVYKSTEIRGLRTVEPVEVTNGVYRDRIDTETNLVFYRID